MHLCIHRHTREAMLIALYLTWFAWSIRPPGGPHWWPWRRAHPLARGGNGARQSTGQYVRNDGEACDAGDGRDCTLQGLQQRVVPGDTTNMGQPVSHPAQSDSPYMPTDRQHPTVQTASSQPCASLLQLKLPCAALFSRHQECLLGDMLVAAATIAYLGAFTAPWRARLVQGALGLCTSQVGMPGLPSKGPLCACQVVVEM